MRSHTFKVLDLDTFNTEAITLKLEACIHTIFTLISSFDFSFYFFNEKIEILILQNYFEG